MQLGRLRAFVQEVLSDASIIDAVATHEVCHQVGADWYRSSERVADAALTERLTVVSTVGSHWRARNSKVVFFPVESLQAVVIATFASAPRKQKQDSFAGLIARALQHSTAAFDASHDTLTGLLNRQAFDDELAKALARLSPGPGTSVEAGVRATLTVALLALDIDNFKQVNDTHGHLFGDVVLRAMGQRLHAAALDIQKRHGGRAELELGRPGGEEFLFLVCGALSEEEILEIGESIRKTVSDEELPSDEEFQTIASSYPSLALPSRKERVVTISVGVASLVTVPQELDTARAALQLRDRADTALYRAKSGGKNVVRRFEDILQHHGTILEHHSETDVVAIDLGRAVGLKVGQEFLVFHPDFTGTRPFVVSDGRSRRRLGDYPRNHCGRIVVFAVQQDISFCHIVDRQLRSPFPVGASLEAVPMGTITHLLTPPSTAVSFVAPTLSTADKLPELVAQSIGSKKHPATVVLRLANLEQLAEARGSSYVNQALAWLYESVREVFPADALISQVRSTQLAVAVRDGTSDKIRELTHRAIEVAEKRCSGLAKFRAGVSAADSLVPRVQKAGDESRLDSSKLLDYATFAAAVDEPNMDAVLLFDANIAFRVVRAQYLLGRHRDALADYRALLDLGVSHSQFHSQGAITAQAVGESEREFALGQILKAATLDPNDPMIRANQGYVNFSYGNSIDAYAAFARIPPEFPLPGNYFGARALSAYACLLAGVGGVDRKSVIALLESAVAANKREISAKDRDAAAAALRLLRTAEPATPGLQAASEADLDPEHLKGS